MGSVFKKIVTRPLPPNAELITRKGERLARWRDAKGKVKTARLAVNKEGAERIRDESSTYFARYRDGNGHVVEVSAVKGTAVIPHIIGRCLRLMWWTAPAPGDESP